MKKLGHDFGRTPFGFHQVLARVRRHCICDPRFAAVAADIACPEHGLEQHLRQIVSNLKATA